MVITHPTPGRKRQSGTAAAKRSAAATRASKTASKQRSAPSNWGTVQQLPSGNWRAFFRHEGQRISAPTTFETKAAAQRWLSTQHADIVRGAWVNPALGKVTLAEYARYWLGTRADLAPRTAELYESYLKRWLLAPVTGAEGQSIDLSGKHLTDLSPVTIRSWHGALLHATAASATARTQGKTAATRYDQSGRRVHPARAWGKANGFDVPTYGRLTEQLREAWRKAGSPTAPAAARPNDPRAGRSTTAKAYSLLRTILGAAVNDGVLSTNPCRIPGAGQDHTPERPVATPAEVQQLAAAMPEHLRAAVHLAAWGALRYGELFALARRHINLEANTVRVERALLWRSERHAPEFTTPKTRKSVRTVHLPPFVTAALAAHLEHYTAPGSDTLVFANPRTGRPISRSWLTVQMRRAREQIGRPDLHWHDLRHTGATLAYRAGASVPQVQARLGHTTMRAAAIYAHAADDSDRLLAGRLHEMFASDEPEATRDEKSRK